MRVFDFDNTIYNGETVVDFFLFCVKKKKTLCLYIPLVVYTTILYKLNILSINKLYRLASKMSSAVINNKENAGLFVKEFWEGHECKIKQEYLDIIEPNDVVITASPRMIIEGINNKINTKNFICSEFNLDTGKFEFICMGKNKVIKFKETYPNATIKEFYTDSLTDKPLIQISEKTYLIKGEKTKKIITNNSYK